LAPKVPGVRLRLCCALGLQVVVVVNVVTIVVVIMPLCPRDRKYRARIRVGMIRVNTYVAFENPRSEIYDNLHTVLIRQS